MKKMFLPAVAAVLAATPVSLLPQDPSWQVEGEQAYDTNLGFSVASAGDLNGDGFDDLVVGAPKYDSGIGEGDEGAVFVYFGREGGPSTTPDWLAPGTSTAGGFGRVVAIAGDVDADGYADILVGMPDVEKVCLYRGSPTGPAGGGPRREIDGKLIGGGIGGYSSLFGSSLGGAGDVNGDGYDDVVVGAPGFRSDSRHYSEGAVFIYHGGPSGLSATFERQIPSGLDQAQLGTAVATAGDVNADGYDDVVIGAPYYPAGFDEEWGDFLQGAAFVHLGSPDGIASAPAWSVLRGHGFGHSVASAGDVNGDGFDDVIVGSPSDPYPYGSVRVYHGNGSGLSSLADQTIVSQARGSQFGDSVAAAGDLNLDGYADVIIGDTAFDTGPMPEGGSDRGAVQLHLGGAAGLGVGPVWMVTGAGPVEGFGFSLSRAVNLSGTGATSIVVGSPFYNGGYTDEGRAVTFDATAVNEPANLVQARLDGSVMPPGGGTTEPGVRMSAVVSDPELKEASLQVEVKPVGVAFDGAGTVAGPPVADGTVASVELTGLVSGTWYHWRCRSLNRRRAASAWKEFESPGETDFLVRTNQAPEIRSLSQSDAVTGADLPPGAMTFEAEILLEATGDDADLPFDPAERVAFEVEVRPAGEAFTGVATAAGPLVLPGTVASIRVPVPAEAMYCWRGRMTDRFGTRGAWSDFGTASGFDFLRRAAGSLGASGCAGTAATDSAPAILPLLLMAGILSLRIRKTRRIAGRPA